MEAVVGGEAVGCTCLEDFTTMNWAGGGRSRKRFILSCQCEFLVLGLIENIDSSTSGDNDDDYYSSSNVHYSISTDFNC